MVRWSLLLLLSGCSSGALYTPEELEWRHQMDRENWALCELAYKNAGVATFHKGHIHGRGIVRIHDVRTDLAINHCRSILGPYWAE